MVGGGEVEEGAGNGGDREADRYAGSPGSPSWTMTPFGARRWGPVTWMTGPSGTSSHNAVAVTCDSCATGPQARSAACSSASGASPG